MLWAGIMVISSLTLVGIPYAQGDTWYVKTDGSDTNGGTSWEDSFQTIQRGIDEAENGDTVLVAEGTYTGPGNKNIITNKEIEVRSVNGPNSCIIDLENEGKGFYLFNISAASVIDGFTIMNGNPTSDLDYGVGIECLFCLTTIRNCIIKNNSGVQWGAGIEIWGSNSHPVIVNTIFSGNHTTLGGSAVTIYQASATFINCTFYGNNSFFSVVSGTPTTSITNCIFWNNDSGAIGGNVTYSDVEGGYIGTGNIDIDPEFVDPDNGDFRLSSASDCIDAGNNLTTGIPDKDIEGKPRFIDGDGDIIATVDMGAYEYGDICEGDFEPEGDVDGSDLAVFAADFGRTDCGVPTTCPGDFDNDGDVDGSDLAIFAADFGRTDCPVFY
jgi:hypothetical protein